MTEDLSPQPPPPPPPPDPAPAAPYVTSQPPYPQAPYATGPYGSGYRPNLYGSGPYASQPPSPYGYQPRPRRSGWFYAGIIGGSIAAVFLLMGGMVWMAMRS